MEISISRKAARRAAMQLIYEKMFGGQGGEYTFNEMILQNSASSENAEDDILSNEAEGIEETSVENLSDSYAFKLFEGTFSKIDELDSIISALSPKRKIERMPGLVLAILRLSIYEILFVKDTPEAVCINEAVSMAKRFGTINDAKLVNGILGAFSRRDSQK